MLSSIDCVAVSVESSICNSLLSNDICDSYSDLKALEKSIGGVVQWNQRISTRSNFVPLTIFFSYDYTFIQQTADSPILMNEPKAFISSFF
jgi:hypothetical protein